MARVLRLRCGQYPLSQVRSTVRPMRILSVLSVLGLLASASPATAATITVLSGYGELTPSVLLQDFETSKDTAWVTFGANTALTLATAATGGVTPSGVQGLSGGRFDDPLRATLAADAYEVGLTFGNDVVAFIARLIVYDAANQSLGAVTLATNANDWADQFIGLRSDVAFRFVEFVFGQDAQNLAMYIDDFAVGGQTAIPEPVSILLLGSGLTGMIVRRDRRGRR